VRTTGATAMKWRSREGVSEMEIGDGEGADRGVGASMSTAPFAVPSQWVAIR
jgi:hypothetical protein